MNKSTDEKLIELAKELNIGEFESIDDLIDFIRMLLKYLIFSDEAALREGEMFMGMMEGAEEKIEELVEENIKLAEENDYLTDLLKGKRRRK